MEVDFTVNLVPRFQQHQLWNSSNEYDCYCLLFTPRATLGNNWAQLGNTWEQLGNLGTIDFVVLTIWFPVYSHQYEYDLKQPTLQEGPLRKIDLHTHIKQTEALSVIHKVPEATLDYKGLTLFIWSHFLATSYFPSNTRNSSIIPLLKRKVAFGQHLGGNTFDCVGLTVYFSALPAISWTARDPAA